MENELKFSWERSVYFLSLSRIELMAKIIDKNKTVKTGIAFYKAHWYRGKTTTTLAFRKLENEIIRWKIDVPGIYNFRRNWNPATQKLKDICNIM